MSKVKSKPYNQYSTENLKKAIAVVDSKKLSARAVSYTMCHFLLFGQR